MTDRRIITCNGCDRPLGIPGDKRTLEVICKYDDCGARFFWELGNDKDPKRGNPIDYYRTLNGVCGDRKELFKIFFSKRRIDPYYRFERTEPIISYKFKNLDEDLIESAGESNKEIFRSREFSWTYRCHYCGDRRPYIYCVNCKHFICGSVRYLGKDAEERGTCPICLTDFKLDAYPIAEYTGDSIDERDIRHGMVNTKQEGKKPEVKSAESPAPKRLKG
jgi:hypothetical protein